MGFLTKWRQPPRRQCWILRRRSRGREGEVEGQGKYFENDWGVGENEEGRREDGRGEDRGDEEREEEDRGEEEVGRVGGTDEAQLWSRGMQRRR